MGGKTSIRVLLLRQHKLITASSINTSLTGIFGSFTRGCIIALIVYAGLIISADGVNKIVNNLTTDPETVRNVLAMIPANDILNRLQLSLVEVSNILVHLLAGWVAPLAINGTHASNGEELPEERKMKVLAIRPDATEAPKGYDPELKSFIQDLNKNLLNFQMQSQNLLSTDKKEAKRHTDNFCDDWEYYWNNPKECERLLVLFKKKVCMNVPANRKALATNPARNCPLLKTQMPCEMIVSTIYKRECSPG